MVQPIDRAVLLFISIEQQRWLYNKKISILDFLHIFDFFLKYTISSDSVCRNSSKPHFEILFFIIKKCQVKNFIKCCVFLQIFNSKRSDWSKFELRRVFEEISVWDVLINWTLIGQNFSRGKILEILHKTGLTLTFKEMFGKSRVRCSENKIMLIKNWRNLQEKIGKHKNIVYFLLVPSTRTYNNSLDAHRTLQNGGIFFLYAEN